MKLTKETPAIVTGGASGLGRATAEAFAAAGVPVAIFDINHDAAQAVAQSIGGTFHHVDILDEDSVVSGFAAARAAQGQERICVHCAWRRRAAKRCHSTRHPVAIKSSIPTPMRAAWRVF